MSDVWGAWDARVHASGRAGGRRDPEKAIIETELLTRLERGASPKPGQLDVNAS